MARRPDRPGTLEKSDKRSLVMFYACNLEKILWLTLVSHLIVSGTASPVISLRSGPVTAADLGRYDNIHMNSYTTM